MKDEALNDILSVYIRGLFEPSLNHPFLDLKTVSVPDVAKPIPKRWVDDVEVALDEGFGAEDGDILGDGPVTSWTAEDGRQRLKEALRRLDLPETHVAHPGLNRMGRHELASEKKRVKQELKRYDAEFRKKFFHLPSHSEKEPMRPLYVYYRRLKTMIAHAEQKKSSRRGATATSTPTGTQSTNGGVSDDDVGSNTALRMASRDPMRGVQDIDDTPREARPLLRASTVEDQIIALQSRVESLQIEKSAVRAKLQAFQETFVNENNRRIRYHKDILPIEREYRMYKNLKEEIVKAEQQLRDLNAK